MAKVFPEKIPLSISEDPKRSAELKVYAALKSLPSKFSAYYGVHWQSDPNDWGMKEGEADFILAHPDLGILVLEVKGGGISYRAESAQWYSQDRYGEYHPIKDPVEQGSRSHYELFKQLKAMPGWREGQVNIGHAVCFPDVFLPKSERLKPDLPRELVIDHDDLEDIEGAIMRIFRALFGPRISSGAPGYDRMQIIEGYLARSFQISTPLGYELDYEEEKLIELTERQFLALSLLGDRKRAAIGGCAGSGKTMLAIKKAQQFSSLGLKVLLVCFNAPLAQDLRMRLPNIDANHFHSLCRDIANSVGFILRPYANEEEYYQVILPEALMDAAAQLGRVYDAIIVDEGQDFKESYWIALESLLKEDGYLYIFFDNNQNLYGGCGDFGGLISEPPFTLTENCRNTKAIHKTVIRFHNNPTGLTCHGPDGRPPELIPYRGEEELKPTLQRTLHRLVNEERVDCKDIIILTPRGEEKTKLISGLRLGMFTLTSQNIQKHLHVQVSSIHRFKGLERRVVILAEIDQRTQYNFDMVMYVGCSRARTHLIILHDADTFIGIS